MSPSPSDASRPPRLAARQASRRRRWCFAALCAALALQALPEGPARRRGAQRGARAAAPGLCALLPPQPSAPLARAPSVAQDRRPAALAVEILAEPVERPLPRYLHKRDAHFGRAVPDWALQYKTAEQQYLYEGEFALQVREATEEGLVVQDAVTGIFGFVPASECPEGPSPAVGALLRGARCTHMDTTVVTSPDLQTLRLQTGVIYEWDERAGEGYILPTEGQDTWRMLRVLRRDVQWHDSRRAFVGQFVQFEAALPEEVPIAPNDEPSARFALRVRSPEVHFSLRHHAAQGGAAPPAAQQAGGAALAPPGGHRPLPAAPGRPTPSAGRARHPVLQRWAEDAPAKGSAESPAWLWEPPMEARDRGGHGARAPVVPLRLRRPRPFRPRTRILTHEVATWKGDLWKEPAMRRGAKAWERQMPPGRWEVQERGFEMEDRQDREQRRQERRWKLRAASLARKERKG